MIYLEITLIVNKWKQQLTEVQNICQNVWVRFQHFG